MPIISFLSYAAAVVAGTVTVGAILAINHVISYGTFHAGLLVYPVSALLMGFLPGAVCFLPVALVGLWAAGRAPHATALTGIAVGAVGAGAIAAVVLSVVQYPVTIYVVGAFACAGGVAALTYYGVRKLQLKLTFGLPRRSNAEWVAEAENHRPGSLEQRSRLD